MAHKFGWGYVPNKAPVAVKWTPSDTVEYQAEQLHAYKWKIFAQEDIIIPGKSRGSSRKTISLKFGVDLTMGAVIISLVQILKNSKCSIQNESVAESTEDIVITVQNNTTNDVELKAGEVLCYLTYVDI